MPRPATVSLPCGRPPVPAAPRHISTDERRARLGVRHLLAPGAAAGDVSAVAEALVALHSSDPATVYLSAAARLAEPSLPAVASALYEERSLVRHHAMRRTLWVLTPEDARVVHAACTAALAPVEWRRLERLVVESGVADDGAAWVREARTETMAALRRLGQATARELGAEAPALRAKLHLAVGKPYAGTQGAHTRVLLNLGFEGEVVRGAPTGSWITSEYTWSPMEAWLPGGIGGLDAREAAAALAARYLARFGPVTTADLRWWAGWTAGTATRALADVGAVAVTLDDGPGWVLPGDEAPVPEPEPWVAFLPSLDPTTMGWKERTFALGELGAFGGPLFDRNGNGGPTVWIDGRVAGGWAHRPNGAVVYRLLANVPAGRRRELERAARRLGELLDGVRVRPRFPTALQKELEG